MITQRISFFSFKKKYIILINAIIYEEIYWITAHILSDQLLHAMIKLQNVRFLNITMLSISEQSQYQYCNKGCAMLNNVIILSMLPQSMRPQTNASNINK